jgi:putative transposase|tara:strand:- start:86 stop:1075 length:990 start_codon:yes stop_codon:yes gene_type:complete
LEYSSYLEGRFSNRKEVMAFLKMVKLKEGKLKWALKQKDKKNKDLAYICGVGVRRFQQLKAHYKETGGIPKLNPWRRPRTELTEEEKKLIDKSVKESKLNGAVKIRLYIDKYYKQKLPYGKIHRYLIANGVSKPDKKKQKQRKYCRYERKHSFSLGHMDIHESKIIPGKQVIAWEDDASRNILSGEEFDNATTENAIKVVKEAKKVAFKQYSAILLALNTDRGSQFYANKKRSDEIRGLSDFERFLKKEGIKHIPSRRNHPQTNGKEERWFRTYNEKRNEFRNFKDFMKWYNDTIHLGLDRKKGVTPNEAILNKLRPGSLMGLFFRRFG